MSANLRTINSVNLTDVSLETKEIHIMLKCHIRGHHMFFSQVKIETQEMNISDGAWCNAIDKPRMNFSHSRDLG